MTTEIVFTTGIFKSWGSLIILIFCLAQHYKQKSIESRSTVFHNVWANAFYFLAPYSFPKGMERDFVGSVYLPQSLLLSFSFRTEWELPVIPKGRIYLVHTLLKRVWCTLRRELHWTLCMIYELNAPSCLVNRWLICIKK